MTTDTQVPYKGDMAHHLQMMSGNLTRLAEASLKCAMALEAQDVESVITRLLIGNVRDTLRASGFGQQADVLRSVTERTEEGR